MQAPLLTLAVCICYVLNYVCGPSHISYCVLLWCVGMYNAVQCAECRDLAYHMLLSYVHSVLIILLALGILCVTGFSACWRSHEKCLLTLTWPFHLSALVTVACIRWISKKFDIGDAFENLSLKSKFG